MEIINKLFSDYLSGQSSIGKEYKELTLKALQKEKQLRALMNEEQTGCFEELFDITSQIHYLEVKDAFFNACKIGAKASKELLI